MKTHEALRPKLFGIFAAVLLLAALAFSSRPAVAQTCEKLAELKLANTTMTAVQSVGAGAFTPATGSAAPFKELPAFCRVTFTAIEYLNTVPAINAIPILKAAARELPSPLDVLAASVLLHHNDVSMLPLVEQSLQKSSKLIVQAEGSRWEFVLSDALTTIRDNASIPALSRLMNSSDPQTRRDAAGALRNIGTEAIIHPLSSALYDEDWEV